MHSVSQNATTPPAAGLTKAKFVAVTSDAVPDTIITEFLILVNDFLFELTTELVVWSHAPLALPTPPVAQWKLQFTHYGFRLQPREQLVRRGGAL